MPIRQKITPHLWFAANTEEAVTFYTSLFADSRIDSISRFGEGGMGEPGSVMGIAFTLQGQSFVAINGGPYYTLTPAASLFVDCADQTEIDLMWDVLSPGGVEMACGWLTDRFGLTWQINAQAVIAMMQDPDAARAARVMQVMMTMKKIDLARLHQAYDAA